MKLRTPEKFEPIQNELQLCDKSVSQYLKISTANKCLALKALLSFEQLLIIKIYN